MSGFPSGVRPSSSPGVRCRPEPSGRPAPGVRFFSPSAEPPAAAAAGGAQMGRAEGIAPSSAIPVSKSPVEEKFRADISYASETFKYALWWRVELKKWESWPGFSPFLEVATEWVAGKGPVPIEVAFAIVLAESPTKADVVRAHDEMAASVHAAGQAKSAFDDLFHQWINRSTFEAEDLEKAQREHTDCQQRARKSWKSSRGVETSYRVAEYVRVLMAYHKALQAAELAKRAVFKTRAEICVHALGSSPAQQRFEAMVSPYGRDMFASLERTYSGAARTSSTDPSIEAMKSEVRTEMAAGRSFRYAALVDSVNKVHAAKAAAVSKVIEAQRRVREDAALRAYTTSRPHHMVGGAPPPAAPQPAAAAPQPAAAAAASGIRPRDATLEFDPRSSFV